MPTGFVGRTRGKKAYDALFVGGKQLATDVTFAIAAGGSNVCEVTLQVCDKDGVAIAGCQVLDVYLSDAATGIGITGTSASGTVQAKSACGTDVGILTAKKALRIVTLADGSYILEITDSAKTGFYVVATTSVGTIEVSRVLATADFG